MWDIDPKYLQEHETIEYEDRPSMFSCVLAYAWTGMMALGVIPTAIAAIKMSTGPDGKWPLAMVLIYVLLALPTVLFILSKKSTRYAISDRGLIRRTGILTTSIKTVSFKHITSVEIKETLAGKMFHYGHLLIDTSGSGHAVEFRWNYIKAAHKVKKLIEAHIGA